MKDLDVKLTKDGGTIGVSTVAPAVMVDMATSRMIAANVRSAYVSVRSSVRGSAMHLMMNHLMSISSSATLLTMPAAIVQYLGTAPIRQLYLPKLFQFHPSHPVVQPATTPAMTSETFTSSLTT